MFADNAEQCAKREEMHHVMDAVNQCYGEFTLAPGRPLNRSHIPNVVAPARQSRGHRQTI